MRALITATRNSTDVLPESLASAGPIRGCVNHFLLMGIDR